MKLELVVFLLVAGFSSIGYFIQCWRAKTIPSLHTFLKLVWAGSSAAGGLKVLRTTWSPAFDSVTPIIEYDLLLGVSLISGAICLFWMAATTIINSLKEPSAPL